MAEMDQASAGVVGRINESRRKAAERDGRRKGYTVMLDISARDVLWERSSRLGVSVQDFASLAVIQGADAAEELISEAADGAGNA